MVGKLMYMDRATAMGERISYAQVFVEVSADKPLVDKVSLQIEEGEEMEIDVTCEWVPPVCKLCKSLGHVDKQYPTSPVWVPKQKM